jgi:hypothetical protein
LALSFVVVGGAFFLWSAFYVAEDKRLAEVFDEGTNGNRNIPLVTFLNSRPLH